MSTLPVSVAPRSRCGPWRAAGGHVAPLSDAVSWVTWPRQVASAVPLPALAFAAQRHSCWAASPWLARSAPASPTPKRCPPLPRRVIQVPPPAGVPAAAAPPGRVLRLRAALLAAAPFARRQ